MTYREFFARNVRNFAAGKEKEELVLTFHEYLELRSTLPMGHLPPEDIEAGMLLDGVEVKLRPFR